MARGMAPNAAGGADALAAPPLGVVAALVALFIEGGIREEVEVVAAAAAAEVGVRPRYSSTFFTLASITADITP